MSSRTHTATVPSPLRSARLRRIVAAYTVNRLGTWFGFIALAVAVYDHTHSAVAVSALLLAGQVLPAFVVPALVARVEASSRRGELSGLYLLEAAATAALAALVWRQFWLPGILLLVALDGTAALAASALLRAAAARCAREWAHDHHARSAPAPESLPAQTFAGQVGVALVAGEQGIEDERDRSWEQRRARGGRAGGRAQGERRDQHRLRDHVHPGPGARRAGRSRVRSARGAADRRRLVRDLRRDAARPAPHVEDARPPRCAHGCAQRGSTSVTRPRCAALLLAQAVALVFFEFSPRHRGGLRQGVACTRATAATAYCWACGASASRSAASCSRARSNGSLGMLLSASTLAVGLAYLGWAVGAHAGSRLRGGADRRDRQRRAVGGTDQRRAAAHTAELARTDDGRGGIARRDLPGDRAGAGRGDRCSQFASGRVPVAGVGATLSTFAFVRLPLGGLTSVKPDPEGVADDEPEWAPESASSSVPSAP